MSATPDRGRLVAAFWVAVGVSVVAHLAQPWGRYALYPFALLATWAHEMGHGLTALLVGGDFLKLELYADLGGRATHTATGFLGRPLVAMGGLLGPAVAGAVVIVLGARSERAARAAVWVLAAALAVSVLVWVPFVSFGAGALALVAVALAAVAWSQAAFLEIVVTQLVGIQLCLGSLSDVDYMFTKEFPRGGRMMASDTQHIAEHWLLPYWVWGGLIACLSVAILLAAFYVAWLRGPAAAASSADPGDAEPSGVG